MYPAEMSFRGFPIINRFRAEEPKEKLLFQAWLGKPLVVYTHHEFFRNGMARTLDVSEFLDRQVNPTWGSIEFILNGNYQWRRSEQTREVRLFSNAVTVGTDRDLPISGVLKPGACMATQEVARINGAEAEVAEHGELGLVVDDAAETPGQLSISFEPRRQARATLPYRTPLRAKARRLATEVRDYSSAVLARSGRRRTPTPRGRGLIPPMPRQQGTTMHTAPC